MDKDKNMVWFLAVSIGLIIAVILSPFASSETGDNIGLVIDDNYSIPDIDSFLTLNTTDARNLSLDISYIEGDGTLLSFAISGLINDTVDSENFFLYNGSLICVVFVENGHLFLDWQTIEESNMSFYYESLSPGRSPPRFIVSISSFIVSDASDVIDLGPIIRNDIVQLNLNFFYNNTFGVNQSELFIRNGINPWYEVVPGNETDELYYTGLSVHIGGFPGDKRNTAYIIVDDLYFSSWDINGSQLFNIEEDFGGYGGVQFYNGELLQHISKVWNNTRMEYDYNSSVWAGIISVSPTLIYAERGFIVSYVSGSEPVLSTSPDIPTFEEFLDFLKSERSIQLGVVVSILLFSVLLFFTVADYRADRRG